MRREVRILLVGDEGVGKSSLITTLLKETFIPQVEHVLPEVNVPADVTPDNINTQIVDSSSRPENKLALESEIRRAHVIAIVYGVDEPKTLKRVSNHWLPYIRSLGVNVPIVLVGNKIDTRGDQVNNESLEDDMLPIMSEFKEVETCVECSAKTQLNVSEVFYFAQKAVLHPTAPLYDSREHILKPACAQALTRIFRLCDKDMDNHLSDEELNAFQRKCFLAPLQNAELEGVKQVVRENDPLGVSDRGLTLNGFLFLHKLFIQRGRIETTWAVLRKFGYGDDVNLSNDFLFPPSFTVPVDAHVELSAKGYQFLTDLFYAHDRDKDGALRFSELESLFATSPGNPWTSIGFPDTTVTNEVGSVTLHGFLAQWSMTTLLDYKTTLAYLAYLGYEDASSTSKTASSSNATTSPSITENDIAFQGTADSNAYTALKVVSGTNSTTTSLSSSSSLNNNGTVQNASSLSGGSAGNLGKSSSTGGKRKDRNTFLCYVIGATGSGKTALLRNFVQKPFQKTYSPTLKPYSVVNSCQIQGMEKYLVLMELGTHFDHEILQNKKKMAMCDLILFVYDSSDIHSFSYIYNLRNQYQLDDYPSVFVATKSDLDLVQQRNEVQPDIYCRNLNISVPIAISIKDSITANLFNSLTAVALDPIVATPRKKSGKSIAGKGLFSSLWFKISLGTTIVGLSGYIFYKYFFVKENGEKSSSSLLDWVKKKLAVTAPVPITPPPK